MNNLIVTDAAGSVADAVQALEAQLAARGIQVFAAIDHAAGARSAGLQLADEVVLVFGNPAVGTAIMQDDARAGLDLPLRMLVWDDGGRTRVAYHDPRELSEVYGLSSAEPVLDTLRSLLSTLAAAVAPPAAG